LAVKQLDELRSHGRPSAAVNGTPGVYVAIFWHVETPVPAFVVSYAPSMQMRGMLAKVGVDVVGFAVLGHDALGSSVLGSAAIGVAVRLLIDG
jgi:hypothetical protein